MNLVPLSSEFGHETSREIFVTKRLTEFVESSEYKIIKQQYLRLVVPKQSLPVEPEEDTEIFVCRIPEVMLEDELFNIFSAVGPICEIRLMVTPSGTYNRRFAFVRFYRQVDADEAIRRFNYFKMPMGRNLRVTKSYDNRQLFLKGFDFKQSRFEIFRELQLMGFEGVRNVRVVKPRDDIPFHVNRGYAFVDFVSHKAAASARKEFRTNLVLFNRKILIDWALPLSQALHNNTTQQFTTIFIRNVTPISKVQLIQILERAVPLGEIRKIFLKRKYCYIHFYDRKFGESAFANLTDFFESSGQHHIEVSWAKPQRTVNAAGSFP